MKQQMAIQVSSKEEAWITPEEIISLVKEVLGEIDLDPASSAEANKIIGASRIITKAEDALTKDWNCKTFFLNPPYGKVRNKSQAGIFAEYAIEQYYEGNIEQGGIILLHDRSGYNWFENLAWTLPSATLRERIRFVNPSTMKQGDQAKTAQTLFLIGSDVFLNKFVDVFKPYARIHLPDILTQKTNFVRIKDSTVS